MKIGDKFVKDGEVVEVIALVSSLGVEIVWYAKSRGEVEHCLTKADFLEQYKPYEPVYEYRYCFETENGYDISSRYFTDKDIKPTHWINYQRLGFTKKEKVQ